MILGPLRAQINDTPVLSIINTPSPPPEPPSSATNSPPDSIMRAKKLNDKLFRDLTELAELSKRMQRHVCRSIYANLLLSQRLEICEASLKDVCPTNQRQILKKQTINTQCRPNSSLTCYGQSSNKKEARHRRQEASAPAGKTGQGIGIGTTGSVD